MCIQEVHSKRSGPNFAFKPLEADGGFITFYSRNYLVAIGYIDFIDLVLCGAKGPQPPNKLIEKLIVRSNF